MTILNSGVLFVPFRPPAAPAAPIGKASKASKTAITKPLPEQGLALMHACHKMTKIKPVTVPSALKPLSVKLTHDQPVQIAVSLQISSTPQLYFDSNFSMAKEVLVDICMCMPLGRIITVDSGGCVCVWLVDHVKLAAFVSQNDPAASLSQWLLPATASLSVCPPIVGATQQAVASSAPPSNSSSQNYQESHTTAASIPPPVFVSAASDEAAKNIKIDRQRVDIEVGGRLEHNAGDFYQMIRIFSIFDSKL